MDSLFPCEGIVYLSPDATEDLETIDPQAVYVVGGIVDRTVIKNLSLSRASSMGFRTVKFPIRKYIDIAMASPVLTIEQAVRILLGLKEGKVLFAFIFLSVSLIQSMTVGQTRERGESSEREDEEEEKTRTLCGTTSFSVFAVCNGTVNFW